MTLVKDCFDDPTATLGVSPRELSLILTALNVFNDHLHKGDYKMEESTLQRWYDLLDYVQEETLMKGYRTPVERV